jgi:hypothetical protein
MGLARCGRCRGTGSEGRLPERAELIAASDKNVAGRRHAYGMSIA